MIPGAGILIKLGRGGYQKYSIEKQFNELQKRQNAELIDLIPKEKQPQAEIDLLILELNRLQEINTNKKTLLKLKKELLNKRSRLLQVIMKELDTQNHLALELESFKLSVENRILNLDERIDDSESIIQDFNLKKNSILSELNKSNNMAYEHQNQLKQELGNQVRSINDNINAIESRQTKKVASLHQELESNSKKIVSNDRIVQELKTSLNQFKQNVESINEGRNRKIAELENKIELSTQKALDRLVEERRVSEEGIRDVYARLSSEIDMNKKNITLNKDSINELKVMLYGLEKIINSNRSTIEELTHKIEYEQQHLKNNIQEINTMLDINRNKSFLKRLADAFKF